MDMLQKILVKVFSIREIRLETWENNLEIHDFYYGKLLFTLIIDNPEVWEKTFRELINKYSNESFNEFHERLGKVPEELNKLFELKQEALEKILAEIRKERLQLIL